MKKIKLAWLFKLSLMTALISLPAVTYAEYYISYGSYEPQVEIYSYSPSALSETDYYSCGSYHPYHYGCYHPVRHYYHRYHRHPICHHRYRYNTCCNCHVNIYYTRPSYIIIEDNDFDLDRRTADDVGNEMDIDY